MEFSQTNCTREELLVYSSATLRCLTNPKLTPCPVVRKTALDIFGCVDPMNQWDNSCLIRTGLERESNDSYARLFVDQWMRKCSDLFSHNSGNEQTVTVQPIMVFVTQLDQPQMRISFMRNILSSLTSDSVDGSSEPRIECSLDRTSRDPHLMRFLIAHIGIPELIRVIRTSTGDNFGSYELRYACFILLQLTEFAHLDPSVWCAVLERAELFTSDLKQFSTFQAITSLSPMLLLLARLVDLKANASDIPRYFGILTEAVRLCTVNNTLDTTELSISVLRVLGQLPTELIQMLCETTPAPLVFLFECLLNYGQYQLQDVACATCQLLLTDFNGSEIGEAMEISGIPLPYVVFSRVLQWLGTHGGLKPPQLVRSIVIPLLQRISLPVDEQVQKDIRVFAHGSEDRIFDFLHTMEMIVTALGVSSSEVQRKASPKMWIDFKLQLDKCWLDRLVHDLTDDMLLNKTVQIRCELSRRSMEFLTRNWPISVGK
ncbi:unnamed protein product [Echinostoma caproni]|uniref:MYND-type domain-containing protein n=1 Tax=Echinostoma caproni TaxID=27848 RepID=A0A183B1H1_9TREM|nr:unnamed protein product [Echinostoma caproni]